MQSKGFALVRTPVLPVRFATGIPNVLYLGLHLAEDHFTAQ